MDQNKLEADDAGFRCRGCGITVLGDPEHRPLLCTSCLAKQPKHKRGESIPIRLKPNAEQVEKLRLQNAAPALLACCQELAQHLAIYAPAGHTDMILRAREAISQATGKPVEEC